ncbi:MAG: hypothetical protein LQ342_005938 [Letrouitia transgressa]|nr:MAG: hypothetical protein LQ342_005938 [Letrouitia transgressa]
MSSHPAPPSAFRTLYRKWKSLKLPWRRRWLAGISSSYPKKHQSPLPPPLKQRAKSSSQPTSGTDLAGNAYYYFAPTSSARPRRILQQNSRVPYADIQIPPQWHQWLRYTRPTPPTLQEQQDDVLRQERLKVLAQRADERWRSKPSLMDRPRRRNLELGVGDGDGGGGGGGGGEREGTMTVARKDQMQPEEGGGVEGGDAGGRGAGQQQGRAQNPWQHSKPRGAGEDWQPESWQPSTGLGR